MRGGVARWLAVAAAVVSASTAFSGDLTPPGAPAPSMKTLNEVEARIPVGPLTTPGDATAIYVITQPGSYYLTGDVVGQAGSHGVVIVADDVTLDLNGFTLRGEVGAVHGVHMPNYRTNIAIRNGVIRLWPGHGASLMADNATVEDVRFHANGRWAIENAGGFGGRVERCNFYFNGTDGLAQGGAVVWPAGLLRDCVAYANLGGGLLGSLVVQCQVQSTFAKASVSQPGHGIQANLVESCISIGNNGTGVTASVARGCLAFGNGITQYNAPNVVESF